MVKLRFGWRPDQPARFVVKTASTRKPIALSKDAEELFVREIYRC
jgi:hypothetical protein